MRAILAAMVLGSSTALAFAEDPTGIWAMDNGKVTVEVSNCGDGLCGRIVALKKPLDRHGNPKLDKDNPNPSLRNRPLLGLALLQDMRQAGDNKWQGLIYNPDDGRTYDAVVNVNGTTMKVRGCVVVFCKTKKFLRVN